MTDSILAWHSGLLRRAQDEPTPAGHAVAAVLEEHRVLRFVWYDDRPVCRACWYAADRTYPTEHPCPTVQAISRAFGVPVPRIY